MRARRREGRDVARGAGRCGAPVRVPTSVPARARVTVSANNSVQSPPDLQSFAAEPGVEHEAGPTCRGADSVALLNPCRARSKHDTEAIEQPSSDPRCTSPSPDPLSRALSSPSPGPPSRALSSQITTPLLVRARPFIHDHGPQSTACHHAVIAHSSLPVPCQKRHHSACHRHTPLFVWHHSAPSPSVTPCPRLSRALCPGYHR